MKELISNKYLQTKITEKAPTTKLVNTQTNNTP